MSLALNDLPPATEPASPARIALPKRRSRTLAAIRWTFRRLPVLFLNLLLLLLVIGLAILTWCPVWFGASGR